MTYSRNIVFISIIGRSLQENSLEGPVVSLSRTSCFLSAVVCSVVRLEIVLIATVKVGLH